MADPAITLRLATVDDAGIVGTLNRVVQALHHEALPSRFKPPADETAMRDHFSALIVHPDHRFVLAFCGDEPAGYVYFEIRRSPETVFATASVSIYIHHISVGLKFRKRGIGSALMASVESAARNAGIDMVQVDFWTFNAAAREFYRSLSYVPFNERWWKLS